MKKIIKHYPMTDRLIVRRGYLFMYTASPNTCTPNGAGIGYISRAPDLTPWYLCVVRVALWSIVLSFFNSFSLTIVCSVLQLTASDYPYSIFKLVSLITLSEHLSSLPVCVGFALLKVLHAVFCGSLFVFLSFFFWPLQMFALQLMAFD